MVIAQGPKAFAPQLLGLGIFADRMFKTFLDDSQGLAACLHGRDAAFQQGDERQHFIEMPVAEGAPEFRGNEFDEAAFVTP